MLSEGILSEIESICSSVGKKGGKKWVQFVSVAANKIWASVRGERNKKGMSENHLTHFSQLEGVENILSILSVMWQHYKAKFHGTFGLWSSYRNLT